MATMCDVTRHETNFRPQRARDASERCASAEFTKRIADRNEHVTHCKICKCVKSINSNICSKPDYSLKHMFLCVVYHLFEPVEPGESFRRNMSVRTFGETALKICGLKNDVRAMVSQTKNLKNSSK